MSSNTQILIRRSLTTNAPSSLKQGELAYSYLSNTAFIGSPDGAGVLKIGGQYYTKIVDDATSSATGSTLVKRDSSGNTSVNTLFGSLGTPSGVTPGSYGDNAHIPVITVTANGIVTGLSTTAISTNLDFNDDKGGTGSVNLLTGSFDFKGTEGVVTSASGNTLTFSTDDTVVRSNTAMIQQTIDGDVYISGNLHLSGNTFTTDVTNLMVSDPLLYLANNNFESDIVDIGFVGHYFDGVEGKHAGVFRHAGDKQFYIFDNYTPEPDDNVINPASDGFRLATVNANVAAPLATITQATITQANVSGNMGVAGNIYTTGFNRAAYFKFKDNSATITTDGAASSGSGGDIILTPDTANYLAGVQIAGNGYVLGPDGARNMTLGYNSTSGLVGINKAQIWTTTDSSSTSTGALVVDGGAGIAKNLYVGQNVFASNNVTAGAGVKAAGTYTGPYVDGIVMDYVTGTGRISVGSNDGFAILTGGVGSTPIFQLDKNGVITTSTWQGQTVQVPYGGTGRTSFTTNGIIYGNSNNGLLVTAAAGSADQTWSNQIMTVDNNGVPVWTSAVDGGQF